MKRVLALADKSSDNRGLLVRIRDLLFDYSNDVDALEQNASAANDALVKAQAEAAELQASLRQALVDIDNLQAENAELREQAARLSASNANKDSKVVKRGD